MKKVRLEDLCRQVEKEVKIVFTNDLESNTGKMKKAREKGIEIRVY